jgi:hypothetical protein
MMPKVTDQVPDAQRDLVEWLWISDSQTNGEPQLKPEQVDQAREYLEDLLMDVLPRLAHVRLLEKYYKAKFDPPLPRRLFPGENLPAPPPPAGFRHNQLLPPEVARAVAEQGPNARIDDQPALPDSELAKLLLNPLALWDVSDLIDTLLPRYWDARMDAIGRRYLEESGLEIQIPGIDYEPGPEDRRGLELVLAGSLMGQGRIETQGASCRKLLFTDDAAKALSRRIAEHTYGNAEQDFTLLLHRVPAEGGQVQAALEIAPAPTRQDLEVTLTFPAGGERTFTLKKPEKLRPKTRSAPCAPLPAAAFEFKGVPEWRDDAWPPHLVL